MAEPEITVPKVFLAHLLDCVQKQRDIQLNEPENSPGRLDRFEFNVKRRRSEAQEAQGVIDVAVTEGRKYLEG